MKKPMFPKPTKTVKKNKRIGRPKLGSYKALCNKAWAVFAKHIRNRDPLCITCGAKTTEAGHFIHARKSNILSFDDKNINGQCTYCNRYRHGELGAYAINLNKKFGVGTAEELLSLKHEAGKASREFLEEIIRRYS